MELTELESKSNNELLFEIKKMEAEYEALKISLLNTFDKMTELEHLFGRANEILVKRLKA